MMPALRFFRASALGLCTGLFVVGFASGCADPQGEYDAFAERYDTIAARNAADASTLPETGPEASTNEGGEGGADVTEEPFQCDRPGAGELAPYYYVAFSAMLARNKPIMFLGTLTWNGTGLSMVFQPLDATDHKTPQGSPVQGGPFTVNADGSFDADMGSIAVTGAANPISGSDIETTGQLHAGAGQFCKPVDFMCGWVSGIIALPNYLQGTSLETNGGSYFTMTAMPDATSFPSGKIIVDCNGTEASY